MKKLLFMLFLPIPFIGFGQEILHYNSKFLKFSYFNTFTLDDSRYYIDSSNKDVKLSCNTCDYGSLDNILIINVPVNGGKKINAIELFNDLKKDTELSMSKIGVNSDFSLVKIGAESINSKDITFLTTKNYINNLGTTYQKIYLYQAIHTSYLIILTTSTIDDLYKRQNDVDIILKTLKIK